MVTPWKDTQPAVESQAKPERFPSASFLTPLWLGERLVHPSFSLHAYPVKPESATVMVDWLGAKLTQPPTLLHAYF